MHIHEGGAVDLALVLGVFQMGSLIGALFIMLRNFQPQFKNIVSAVLLIGFLAAAVQAETPYALDWTKQISTSNYVADYDEIFAVDTDLTGNVFVGGYTYDTSTITSKMTDSFISKYSDSGTLQWRTQWENYGFQKSYGVATDTSGNVFDTGHTDYDGILNDSYNVYLRKYNTSTGLVAWTQTLVSSDGKDDLGASVATDTSGNIFVSGWTAGNLDGTNAGLKDAFVSKYTSGGSLSWTSQLGTTRL